MNRETIYARLRSIGAEPETADFIACHLEHRKDATIEAYLLWAGGFSIQEAAGIAGVSERQVQKIVKKVSLF